MDKRFSIICQLENCYVCKRQPIEKHEVFYGKNRQTSIRYGLVIPLCLEHHRGQNGVHGTYGHLLNNELKKMAQLKAMEHYNWTVDEFRTRFGKNYL